MNQYPVCPENISIKKDYLSEWQKIDYNESKITKLCCTLLPKNNYVINYRYLKLALSLGVKLEKINRVLGFKPKHSIEEAVMDLCQAFKEDKLPNSFDDNKYYNVRTMKAIGTQ